MAKAPDEIRGSVIDTHALLWLLVAFCLGTLWQPAVMLVEPAFTIDNNETENGK